MAQEGCLMPEQVTFFGLKKQTSLTDDMEDIP